MRRCSNDNHGPPAVPGHSLCRRPLEPSAGGPEVGRPHPLLQFTTFAAGRVCGGPRGADLCPFVFMGQVYSAAPSCLEPARPDSARLVRKHRLAKLRGPAELDSGIYLIYWRPGGRRRRRRRRPPTGRAERPREIKSAIIMPSLLILLSVCLPLRPSSRLGATQTGSEPLTESAGVAQCLSGGDVWKISAEIGRRDTESAEFAVGVVRGRVNKQSASAGDKSLRARGRSQRWPLQSGYFGLLAGASESAAAAPHRRACQAQSGPRRGAR